jgi:hypothetical protein
MHLRKAVTLKLLGRGGMDLDKALRTFSIKGKNKSKYVAVTVLLYTVFWRADGIAFLYLLLYFAKKNNV